MKKLLLSISFFAALALNAQYTITSSSNPVVGNVDASIATNTAGLVLPTSGTNKLWNYTSVAISSTNAVSSNTYIALSSVPNASLYSGATIGTTDGQGGYEVYKYGTQWEYLGSAAATATDCAPYSNSYVLINLPFTYNSTFSDNFAVSSPQYTLTGNSSVIGDGTGTLTVPGFTFTNVLKVAQSYTENVNFSGTLLMVKGINHFFYSSASKFPLFTIGTQTQTVGSSTTISTNAAINKSFTILGIEESAIDNHFNVYPNPVTSKNVNISFTNESANSIHITLVSVLGQVVKETTYDNPLYGDNNLSMDLKNVTPGIYYLKIKTGSTESVKKLVIE